MVEDGRMPSAHHRPARNRHEQALRAEARTIQRFLKGVAQLHSHRGSQPSKFGAAVAAALQAQEADSQGADAHPMPQTHPPLLCRHYLCGKCTWGDRCRFSHGPPPCPQDMQQQQPQQQPQQVPLPASASTLRLEAEVFTPLHVQHQHDINDSSLPKPASPYKSQDLVPETTSIPIASTPQAVSVSQPLNLGAEGMPSKSQDLVQGATLQEIAPPAATTSAHAGPIAGDVNSVVAQLLAGRDLAGLSWKTFRKEVEQRLGVPEDCLAARKGEVKAAALAYMEQNKSSDSAAASAPVEQLTTPPIPHGGRTFAAARSQSPLRTRMRFKQPDTARPSSAPCKAQFARASTPMHSPRRTTAHPDAMDIIRQLTDSQMVLDLDDKEDAERFLQIDAEIDEIKSQLDLRP